MRRYLNATCYFLGPIIDTVLTTPAAASFNETFESAIDLTNITDRFVASPLLQAVHRCVDGPVALQAVPSWLYYGLGRLQVVSIDSSSAASNKPSNHQTLATSPATLATESGTLHTAAMQVIG